MRILGFRLRPYLYFFASISIALGATQLADASHGDFGHNPESTPSGNLKQYGQNAGYHAYEFQNNNSNNQGNVKHWNGSSNTSAQSNSGTNGQDWRLWRVNGVLKAKAGGNSIVTLQASGDRRDYVIWNQAQSPNYCRVKQAFRNASGGA